MKKRKSIRKFTDEPVSDAEIKHILEVARWSMSGANAQPWEFIVIRSEQVKEKLVEIHLKYEEAKLAIEETRSHEYRQPRFRIDHPLTVKWKNAPVILAVLGDKRTMQASTLFGRLYLTNIFDQNMSVVTFSVHLATAALGLGAAWISLHDPVSEEMKQVLGIPAILTLFALVPIGHPAIQPISYRRELDEMVHYERYDLSKFRSIDDIQNYIKSLRKRHEKAKSYPSEPAA
jgi:nitroreductase